MARDLIFAPATDLVDRIARGDLSPVEVVDAHLDRIDDRSEAVNAWITVLAEEARERAQEAERAVEAGEELGPLHGIPIGLKDLSAAKEGVRHTFGSAAFADNVATKTSPFVARLEEAGAIVLGKTNLPAFGHKPKTENDLAGITSTPFDPDRNAGGSSGGSAAAVGDGQVPLAQGGDAGGSVRIPSSLCGNYGIKPSFGRIPNPSRPDAFGAHTPFSDRGVHARTVADAALALDVMVGPHPRDPFSLPDDGTDYLGAIEENVEDWHFAYSPDLGVFPVDPRVQEVVQEAAVAFEEAGATVEEIEFDPGYSLDELTERARHPAMRVKTASLVENVKEGYGVDVLGDDRDAFPAELVERAEAGYEYGGVAFKRADTVRTELYDVVQDVFDEYDMLLTPTVATLPFRNEEPGPTEVDGVVVDPLSGWFLTWPFNLTGHPAASIPAGMCDGLPVGMQLVGPRFGDDAVLTASATFESLRPWAEMYPPEESTNIE